MILSRIYRLTCIYIHIHTWKSIFQTIKIQSITDWLIFQTVERLRFLIFSIKKVNNLWYTYFFLQCDWAGFLSHLSNLAIWLATQAGRTNLQSVFDYETVTILLDAKTNEFIRGSKYNGPKREDNQTSP